MNDEKLVEDIKNTIEQLKKEILEKELLIEQLQEELSELNGEDTIESEDC